MDLALFTSFDGRIPRSQWWLGIVLLIVAEIVVMTVIAMYWGAGVVITETSGPDQYELYMRQFTGPVGLVNLLFLWPTFAIYAKRWHDRDKSGWWTLITLIPLIGWIWMIVELGCLRGTDGPNRFGPDPLAD